MKRKTTKAPTWKGTLGGMAKEVRKGFKKAAKEAREDRAKKEEATVRDDEAARSRLLKSMDVKIGGPDCSCHPPRGTK